jgi:hypothetical protein
MSNRRRPRAAVIGLLDQADAANHHAAGLMRAMADHDGTRVQHVDPGPITRTIVERLNPQMIGNVINGKPCLCPHLSCQAPALAWWLPYAPGLIRCIDCMKAAALSVRGTGEDNTCDGCRGHAPRIHVDATQLPSIVLDLPRIPATAVPPVIVSYGLCPTCQTKDEAS